MSLEDRRRAFSGIPEHQPTRREQYDAYVKWFNARQEIHRRNANNGDSRGMLNFTIAYGGRPMSYIHFLVRSFWNDHVQPLSHEYHPHTLTRPLTGTVRRLFVRLHGSK